jgi:hypothetical protein
VHVVLALLGEGEALLTIMNSQGVQASVRFARQGQSWGKTGTVPLGKLFGLSEAEAGGLLNDGKAVLDAQGWKNFWSDYITGLLSTKGPRARLFPDGKSWLMEQTTSPPPAVTIVQENRKPDATEKGTGTTSNTNGNTWTLSTLFILGLTYFAGLGTRPAQDALKNRIGQLKSRSRSPRLTAPSPSGQNDTEKQAWLKQAAEFLVTQVTSLDEKIPRTWTNEKSAVRAVKAECQQVLKDIGKRRAGTPVAPVAQQLLSLAGRAKKSATSMPSSINLKDVVESLKTLEGRLDPFVRELGKQPVNGQVVEETQPPSSPTHDLSAIPPELLSQFLESVHSLFASHAKAREGDRNVVTPSQAPPTLDEIQECIAPRLALIAKALQGDLWHTCLLETQQSLMELAAWRHFGDSKASGSDLTDWFRLFPGRLQEVLGSLEEKAAAGEELTNQLEAWSKELGLKGNGSAGWVTNFRQYYARVSTDLGAWHFCVVDTQKSLLNSVVWSRSRDSGQHLNDPIKWFGALPTRLQEIVEGLESQISTTRSEREKLDTQLRNLSTQLGLPAESRDKVLANIARHCADLAEKTKAYRDCISSTQNGVLSLTVNWGFNEFRRFEGDQLKWLSALPDEMKKIVNRLEERAESADKTCMEMQKRHDNLTNAVQTWGSAQGSRSKTAIEIIGDLRRNSQEAAIQLAEVKRENSAVQDEYTSAKTTISQLKPIADRVPGLQQEVKELTERILRNEAARHLKELKENLADVEKIAAELVEAEKRHYSFSGRNVGTTAMIGFLISHSISQLAIAVGSGNQQLYEAMMSNLVCISGKLSDKGFDSASAYLQTFAKPFQTNGKEREPKDRPEGPMFQFTISQLNESLRIKISPFYITVDQEGFVYRAA